MNRARLLAVARGEVAPDLVIRGARVFASFTKEWLDGDVAVAEGCVAGVGSFDGGEILDAAGAYVVPGLVDAHMHIESSKLMVDEFVRAVLPHGTTAIVCDPHEIANVLGTDGIHWMLDVCEGLPFDVYVMASSCVPASPFESPRRPFTLGDLASILHRRHALGVAEMMNFPGVVAGDPAELDKLSMRGASHIDGHAPGLTGRALDAYIAAGIRSDHEATTFAEALEKRRKGMWVLLREASNARNLVDLLPLVKEYGPEQCAFCTDDREPDFLLREGHINQMCRIAVEHGVVPEDAILMATLNPARYHGLTEVGVVGPGYRADLVVLPDLESFRPAAVVKDGRVVFDEAGVHGVEDRRVPQWVRASVRPAPVTPGDLALPATGAKVRVIETVPGQLLTGERIDDPLVEGGMVVADPGRDFAKIAVVERHHATGRVGVGLVTGFGLTSGAFASTVAHDAHNIVVVGVNDHDMLACIEHLVATGGGIVVADGGRIAGDLPLPVAGLMSDEPLERVVECLDNLHALLREMGVTLDAPFMSLSFLALSVIPKLKITDRGLVDVDRFAIVPLEVGDED